MANARITMEAVSAVTAQAHQCRRLSRRRARLEGGGIALRPSGIIGKMSCNDNEQPAWLK
jgi:hypothetical protein